MSLRAIATGKWPSAVVTAMVVAAALGCRRSPAPRELTPAPLPAPDAAPASDASRARCRRTPAVVAYYAGWSMAAVPPADVRFDGVTDVVLFSLLPNETTLDARSNGLDDARIRAVRDAARAAGACVEVAVGGEKTGARFAAGDALAAPLARFVDDHGLDGVVLDIEPLAAAPALALAEALHARGLVVAIDVAPEPAPLATVLPVLPFVDRVDVMSYLATASSPNDEAILRALAPARERVAFGVAGRADSPRCAGPRFFWEIGALCRGRSRPCILPCGGRPPTER